MTAYPKFQQWLDDEFFSDLVEYKDDQFDQEINKIFYNGIYKYTKQGLIQIMLSGNNSASIDAWVTIGGINIPRFCRLNDYLDLFVKTITSLRMRYEAKISNYLNHSLGQLGVKKNSIKLPNTLSVML